MDIVAFNHAINGFMEQTNKELHELCLPYYRKKSLYPIDQRFVAWNCVFLCALFINLNNLPIERTLIRSLFPEENGVEAVTWYYGLLGEDPIGSYLETIRKLLTASAFEKGGATNIWLPDLSVFRKRVESLNKEYMQKARS